MGPLGHTAISAAVGVGVGAATGSPEAGGIALGVGVLMDLDHLYDFYEWYIRGRSKRVYLLCHAWEYSAAGLVVLASVFFHPFLLAAVLAHLAHVVADQVHNRLPLFSYSIVYRLVKRFDTAYITPGHNVMNSYRGWPRLVPFGGRMTPWYRKRVEPWFEKRVQRATRIQAGAAPSED
jgi:hypothetical protein